MWNCQQQNTFILLGNFCNFIGLYIFNFFKLKKIIIMYTNLELADVGIEHVICIMLMWASSKYTIKLQVQ